MKLLRTISNFIKELSTEVRRFRRELKHQKRLEEQRHEDKVIPEGTNLHCPTSKRFKMKIMKQEKKEYVREEVVEKVKEEKEMIFEEILVEEEKTSFQDFLCSTPCWPRLRWFKMKKQKMRVGMRKTNKRMKRTGTKWSFSRGPSEKHRDEKRKVTEDVVENHQRSNREKKEWRRVVPYRKGRSQGIRKWFVLSHHFGSVKISSGSPQCLRSSPPNTSVL